MRRRLMYHLIDANVSTYKRPVHQQRLLLFSNQPQARPKRPYFLLMSRATTIPQVRGLQGQMIPQFWGQMIPQFQGQMIPHFQGQIIPH